LNGTAIDYPLFQLVAEQYSKGHIHIWLNETDTIHAAKLTDSYDYNSFLKFVYSINPYHPFYLGAVRFNTPQQLVQQAQADAPVWFTIAEAISSGQIHGYATQLEAINANDFYNSTEKSLASVQSMIEIVDNTIPTPQIASDQQKVALLSIEGSKTVVHTIHLRLVTTGFTVANIFLDNTFEGIAIQPAAFTFWKQNGETDCTLKLTIAALQPIKNKTNTTNIQVETEYQNLTIPVQIKVVFPLKAYLIQVFKYALGGAFLFATIRYATGVLARQPVWSDTIQHTNDYTYLPEHYFAYFIGLLALFAVLIGAVFLIRKWEKL
jgi:hypothetical protein